MAPLETGTSNPDTSSSLRYRVLLVDDSDIDRAIYRRFLQQKTCPGSVCQPDSCQFLEVVTGKAALAYCQQSLPDVILLDYLLPDMSGLEVLQELRQQHGQEKLPVIVMTGQSCTDVAVAVLKGGAMDYLDKAQIGVESLHRAVTAVIQQMQLTQALQQQQQRQQLLTSTALRIRQSLALEEILQTTVDEVRQILNCDRVAVYQFQPDWSGQIAVEAVSDPVFSILDSVVTDECFPQEWLEPYSQGRIRAIDNIHTATLSECHVEFLDRLQIQANLIVPILPENHLWGLLVAHECHAPRHWQPDHIELLAQLAIQVSIAIQQSTLVNQLQTQLHEREVAEIALRESEEKLKLLIKYAPASIAMFDRRMHYISASQRWVDDYKLDSIATIIGRSHYDIFPDLPDKWRHRHQRCLAGAIEKCDDDLFVRADGRQQWISWEIRPWYTAAGEIGGIILFSVDVTHRKQVEIALQHLNQELEQRVVERTKELVISNDRLQQELFERERTQQELQLSEARFQAFMNHSPTSAWITDVDGQFLYANQTYFATFQLPTADVNGKSIFDLYPREIADRFLTNIRAAAHSNQSIETSEIAPRRDGTMGEFLVYKFSIKGISQATLIGGIAVDITEHKQKEIALKLSEERFRSTFEDAAIGMALVAPDGLFLRSNPALCQLFGYSQAELKEITFQTITHPDDLTTDQSYRQQVLANKIQSYQLEKRYFHKDGHIIWGLLSVSLVRNEQGIPLYFINQIQDISERACLEEERKRSEAALRQSESILRSFFNNSGLMMGIVELHDHDVLHLSDNPTAARFFGTTQESMQNQFASEIGASSDTIRLWSEHYREAEQTGTAVRFEYLETTPTDSYWLAVNVCQISGYATQHPKFSYVAEDITERKHAEAALRESNRRWRSLLENVQLLVVELDRQGNVEYVNPFFLAVSGFALEDVLGQNWMENFIPGYQKAAIELCFQEVMEHNFHPHHQNPILTKSGEERMISWSNTLLQDAQGTAIGTISIGEDITEHYKLERMKTEFVSVVSHELRTPLTSMQAALSLLVEDIVNPASEEGKNVIQIAANGVDRLVRLVNDILDLERLESGKMRLEKRWCNTADLMTLAIAQMQDMANQAGVALKSTPQSIQIYADGDRLLQVLINLLSNAIKFSGSGTHVALDVAVIGELSSSFTQSSTLLFTVQDQGRGIPADKLESIFERFHQIDASDAREKGGTGLGLAICRSIVQQHGGRIWAESVVEQGSRFHFTLPLERNSHNY